MFLAGNFSRYAPQSMLTGLGRQFTGSSNSGRFALFGSGCAGLGQVLFAANVGAEINRLPAGILLDRGCGQYVRSANRILLEFTGGRRLPRRWLRFATRGRFGKTWSERASNRLHDQSDDGTKEGDRENRKKYC